MSFNGQAVMDLSLILANVESGNFESTILLAMLNHCLRAYYRDGNAVDGSFTLSTASTPALTASTQEYAIFSASNVSTPEEYKFVGYRSGTTSPWARLVQISEADARAYDQQTGTPWGFYEASPAGVYTIGLCPTPSASAAVAGAGILFEYRYKPVDLTALSDIIYLPDEAQNALVPALAKLLVGGDGYSNVMAMQMLDQMAKVEEVKNADADLERVFAEMNINPLVLGGNRPGLPDGAGGNPWVLS